MPGIDELLRSEGALWREEVDAHQPATRFAPRRLPRVWGSTRARVWTVAVGSAAAAAVIVGAVELGTGSADVPQETPAAQRDVVKAPPLSAGAIASGLMPVPSTKVPGLTTSSAGLSVSRSSKVTVGSTSLILTGALSLIVRDNAGVDSAAVRATGIADGAGGRVDADERQTTGTHSATLVLRVPNAALPDVTTQLGRLGTVRSQQRQTKDVTTQVADVTSRVASARAAIAGLTRLYAKARTVGELINVEAALTSRQSDLEALEAQQRTLSAQTGLATLTVSIDVRRSAAAAPQTHHSGFVGGVRQGWHAFTRTGLAVGKGLGAAVPFLLLVAAVGAGGAAVWRARRRRAS